MQMPGRKYQAPSIVSYRYGFNGKEKSDEVYGEGNIYDYGFRIYNSRLGRFLSIDPLTRSYPMLTPYQFAENQPIWAIDLDGLEKYVVTKYYNKDRQVEEIAITVLKEKAASALVNQDLYHNGIKKWQKNVLVRNVYADKPTEYDHLPTLDEEQDKIYKNAKLEVNKDIGNPFGVDYGGKKGDGGQTLNSLRDDFTDEKYQLETRRKLYHFVSNPESNKPRIMYDNGNNNPILTGNIAISDVQNIVNDFKSANPKATDIKTTVVFTTISSNLNYVNKITNRLEALGIKTKVVTNDSYRSDPSSNYTPGKQDFNFSTTVTGVIK